MKSKKLLKNYIIVTFATLVVAAAFNMFFLPFNLVTGGSSGISVIVNYLFSIEPSITVLVVHITILILGYITLGGKKVSRSIYGSLIYPFFIDFTEPLSEYVISLNISSNNLLVFAIFGAVLSGLALGVIHKRGYTTGGSDVVDQIINKYFGLTIGTADFLFNGSIVIIGGFALGFEKILYAVLILYVRGISTDKILIGSYSNKIFYIITKEKELVKQFINNDLGLTVTSINSVGGYSNTGSEILMCVISNRDYFKLKEGISDVDKTAFFLATHAHN
ncbi:MAG: YitT family protein [Bacilli bacterium]|nr:YitT family protein [Bacilli bacterium]MDD4282239.1 YitT family protein [Bacilli bacterium]MDD4718619.1 YitT family protein [Bacilli bacterium]